MQFIITIVKYTCMYIFSIHLCKCVKLYLPHHYYLLITHCCTDLRRKEQERSEKTRSQVHSIYRDTVHSNVTAGSQGILDRT